MINLGILINKPGYNQKFLSLVESAKHLPSDINLTVFFCDYGPVKWDLNFPMMEIIYAYNFEGILISTDPFTTDVMHNALQATKRYNYIWDLYHVFSPAGYANLQNQFNNPTSELIVRSQFLYDNFSRTWRKPKIIMDNFDHEKLSELCQAN